MSGLAGATVFRQMRASRSSNVDDRTDHKCATNSPLCSNTVSDWNGSCRLQINQFTVSLARSPDHPLPEVSLLFTMRRSLVAAAVAVSAVVLAVSATPALSPFAFRPSMP